jgi:hypothetical protein
MSYFGHFSAMGSSTITGPRTADQIAQLWWISWAHFALSHGHSPFFTNWQNYPVGLNFGLNGSLLALGVVFSPITSLFGTIVTWNVLLRLALILSAFSMCLVLRRWTHWWPAAFIGGLLYGFSAYATFNANGYLFLVFVPLPPIIFLLLHEIVVRQQWNPIRPGALLGLVCGVQYLIGAEIVASSILMGGIACSLYLYWNRKCFAAKLPYIRIAGISTVVAGLLSGGFPVLFTLLGPQHGEGPPNSPTNLSQLHGDLLGPFVPGGLMRFTTPHLTLWFQHFQNASMMYLGLPLFLTIGLIVYLLRSRGTVLFAGIMVAISFILSLGSVMYIGGDDTHVPLPFVVLANLPITQGLLSTRFSLYTILFGAAVVALGVEHLYGRVQRSHYVEHMSLRGKSMAASVVSLSIALAVALPMLPAHTEQVSPTDESAVFTSRAVAAIPAGSVLLAYPYPRSPFVPTGRGNSYVHTLAPVNNALLDQAVSDMRFKLVGGFGWRAAKGQFGTPNPSRLSPRSVEALFDESFSGVATSDQDKYLKSANLTADIAQFLHNYRIDTVVVLPLGHDPATVVSHVTAAIGSPSRIDGASVWFHVQTRLRVDSPR